MSKQMMSGYKWHLYGNYDGSATSMIGKQQQHIIATVQVSLHLKNIFKFYYFKFLRTFLK
jgi:hypothetical protein